MATKYDKKNPWSEKLKRLFNCPRMTEEDQKYLNHQYERYKLRATWNTVQSFALIFLFSMLPVVKDATKFKYYTSIAALGVGTYQAYSNRNLRHFEQITTPYFEKYKVK